MILPSSVQPVEIAWTVFSLIGLAAQVSGLNDCICDLVELKRSGKNGARKIVAMNNVRIQVVACIIHLGFASVGVMAMTQEPVGAHQAVTRAQAWFTEVLIVVNLLLVWNAVMGRRSRTRLEREIAKTDHAPAPPAPAAMPSKAAQAAMDARQDARQDLRSEAQEARQDARQDVRQDTRQDVRRDAWESERKDAP